MLKRTDDAVDNGTMVAVDLQSTVKKGSTISSVGFVIPPTNNGVASIFKRPRVPVDL